VIGDRNRIWEHVDHAHRRPGGDGFTRVGNDGFYMATSHVGHDCVVGDNVILAHSATLGGHVQVGDFVMVSGLAAVHQFCRVGPLLLHRRPGGGDQGRDPLRHGVGQPRPPGGAEPGGPEAPRVRRETISELRSAYRLLFAEEGTFQERIDDTAAAFGRARR
jgi:UDP-N-acetylglucosamine acyltransferase